MTEVGKDVPDMALRPVATGYTVFIKEAEVQCVIWTTVFFAEVNTIHNVIILCLWLYSCGTPVCWYGYSTSVICQVSKE